MDSPSQKPPLFLRLLLLASLVLLLLAVGSEVVRRPATTSLEAHVGASDMTIVGGQRVDFVTLGMPLTQAQERLGKGVARPTDKVVVHLFPDYGLSLGVTEGRVVSIYIQSPNFTTRAGLGVGSDVDQVIKTYGSRYEFEGTEQDYTLHFWAQGIHFSVQNNKVTAIQVTEALEGHR